MQEETLHSLSRELHDEFGQVLTAIGAMLRRAEKRLPADSPFCAELREVREVAQATLEKTRSLSQLMHPSILDDGGLEKAIDWYLPVFEKQTGITVRYEKKGTQSGGRRPRGDPCVSRAAGSAEQSGAPFGIAEAVVRLRVSARKAEPGSGGPRPRACPSQRNGAPARASA